LNGCYIKFEIKIKDFGCGIPKEKLDNLFIDFGKLEEHNHVNPTGRGLGLSICRQIINNMGGTVSVKSEVGEGTTFIITLKTMCDV
jgi:signal transduction histidine kinase